jgi:hypothetical protein
VTAGLTHVAAIQKKGSGSPKPLDRGLLALRYPLYDPLKTHHVGGGSFRGPRRVALRRGPDDEPTDLSLKGGKARGGRGELLRGLPLDVQEIVLI